LDHSPSLLSAHPELLVPGFATGIVGLTRFVNGWTVYCDQRLAHAPFDAAHDPASARPFILS